MYDVSCVGILCADVLVKPVDTLPEPGKLCEVDVIKLELGGCASNAAVDLGRLGLKVQLAGKTGEDGFSTFLRSFLTRENVNIDMLRSDSALNTSSSVVHIGSDGERTVLHHPGANAHFKFDDLDINQITDAKLLFVAGSLLMPEFDGVDTQRLLKIAKAEGLICCMDTAWDYRGYWIQKIGKCLPYLDWFMPSYDEAVQLSGEDSPVVMTDFFKKCGAENVVIKLGKDGCYVSPKGLGGFSVPAFFCDKPVDTAGAGDAFCAGFITGIIQGWPIERVAMFANAVAYQCIMSVGTTTGIRNQEEILLSMSNNLLC